MIVNQHQHNAAKSRRETFILEEGGRVRHALDVGSLSIRSIVQVPDAAQNDPKGAWWRAYLAGAMPQAIEPGLRRAPLRSADLFCGPGGLANGVRQLAAEMGRDLVPELIVDQDEEAAQVYAANHGARLLEHRSVASLLDFTLKRTGGDASFVYPPEILDDRIGEAVEGIDVVLAGPPCQGHSNLNNHTRREDPRNALYLTAPAFAVAARARICIIENVPTVLHDSERVVETAERLFRSEGYEVVSAVLNAADFGWPQTRRRHFLVARRDAAPIPFDHVVDVLAESEPRSLWWAIRDLEDTVSDEPLEALSNLSEENQSRIDWLFDHEAHDLDLPERPRSHRGGTTYMSVYGRLYRDRPAPTITTGFMTPGRGRFVHPTRRRALTPREAARLQGFPDSYRFVVDSTNPPGRNKLAKWIGDAVPMPLGYAAAMAALAMVPEL